MPLCTGIPGSFTSPCDVRALQIPQLVPRGHQPDRRRVPAEAVQGVQLPGQEQRDQQERLLPLPQVRPSAGHMTSPGAGFTFPANKGRAGVRVTVLSVVEAALRA